MTFRLQRPPPARRTSPKPPNPPARLTLAQKLTHLATPLHPLLNVTTGLPHPSFPPTLLHYHLLTHGQLDALASYYHQRTPGPWMFAYPYTAGRESASECCGGEGEVGVGRGGGGEGRALGWRREGMGLEEKRRKFGRFCGLRGCESPVLEVRVEVEGDGGEEEEVVVVMVIDGVDADVDAEREREVRERMEREWTAAVRRGREEEEWREKVGGRRFW